MHKNSVNTYVHSGGFKRSLPINDISTPAKSIISCSNDGLQGYYKHNTDPPKNAA